MEDRPYFVTEYVPGVSLVRQAVALSDTVLLGTDLHGNQRIEAIAGEGGAQTAYRHALYKADMVVTL